MNKRLLGLIISLILLGEFGDQNVLAQGPASTPTAGAPAVSSQTQACLGCHTLYTPGIVADWRASRHAAKTPAQALQASALERRVSSDKIPEAMASVPVGCYECHSQNAAAHKDNFAHNGFQINVVVSPNDCKTCHATEAAQYSGSKKANAHGNLSKNAVYSALVEALIGVKQVKDDKLVASKSSDHTRGQTCYSCHGTDVAVKGLIKVTTKMGDLQVPDLTNWPNQGVGRLNPDGSMGACTACHPRHGFSIEVARKPYTCSQCHLEPDVPAWDVYKESKHGNLVLSQMDQIKWDVVPWQVGRDFRAPTCAVCHSSLLASASGETIAPRTHDYGSRLWVRLMGLIYSHPQTKSGDTSTLKNKDGLPLPAAFTGELAAEGLIDKAEQGQRQAAMRSVCTGCHSTTWTTRHFASMDTALAESDQMVLAATRVMVKAWNGGLADATNPFDQALEHKWIQQWLFYANSVRYATAMPGAPDYAVFKNGWWDLTTNLQEMQELVDKQGKK